MSISTKRANASNLTSLKMKMEAHTQPVGENVTYYLNSKLTQIRIVKPLKADSFIVVKFFDPSNLSFWTLKVWKNDLEDTVSKWNTVQVSKEEALDGFGVKEMELRNQINSIIKEVNSLITSVEVDL